MGELLKEIRQHSRAVRYEAMANIIAVHCQSEGEWVWLHKIDSTPLIRKGNPVNSIAMDECISRAIRTCYAHIYS